MALCWSVLFLLVALSLAQQPPPFTVPTSNGQEEIQSSSNDDEILHVSAFEIGQFSRLAHGLRSGPIFIVDEKTFFISNLHYDGRGPDAHFWAGNGTKGPDTQGTLVPDEKGSSDSIAEYTGQNVYVRLPGNLTVYNIDYFGLWCIAYKQNFGYVNVPKGRKFIKPLNDPKIQSFVTRTPKCCQLAVEFVGNEGTCDNGVHDFYPLNITIRNMTDNTVIESVKDEHFYNQPNCTPSTGQERSRLVPVKENFYVTTDGFLMIEGKQRLSQDVYCIDAYNAGNATNKKWLTVAHVCENIIKTEDGKNKANENHVVATLTSLLAACLIVLYV